MTKSLPSIQTWKTMLLSNAFADRQARFATSARGASTANGIAAKTMVQPEPGAPPG